eukprot:3169874-Alexandrium_andersonii.AAC.1
MKSNGSWDPKSAQSTPGACRPQTAQNTPIPSPSPIGTFGLAPLFFYEISGQAGRERPLELASAVT